jgi:hypothetical protein
MEDYPKGQEFFFFIDLGFVQSFAFAKQALYYLNHAFSLFYWLFWRQNLGKYLPRLASDHNPPGFEV